MSRKDRVNTPPLSVSQNTALSQGLFIAVCFLVFYPAFFRGLYYDLEMSISFVLTAILVLGLVWLKMKRQDHRFIAAPLDIAVLIYTIAYLLSLINAVHYGEAWWGFLKVLNYFLIYMLVAQVVTDLKSARMMLKTLLAAAVGVAVVGLLAATGYSDYPGAFVNNHIMSTLQYHNTTAAYLGAMCFVGFALLLTASRMNRKLVYSGAVFLLALVTLTAISKGALLVVIAASCLFFIGTPRRYKLPYLYNLLYLFAIAFATSSLLMPQITGTEPARGLIVIMGGLCLALLGQPLARILNNISEHKFFKGIVITAIIITVLSAGILVQTPAGQKIIPENLVNEITEIADFSDPSYIYRADFIRWGVDIARDYPLIGSGAGGWKALLPQYQDYRYFAADAHNHIIQILVETGVLGLIAYLAIWIAAAMSVIKFSRRADRSDPQDINSLLLLWGSFAAAAAIGLHALIDFDLSIPAVFILLISLLALVNKISVFNKPLAKQQQSRYHLILPVLLAVILLFTGCRLAVGKIYADNGRAQLIAISQNESAYDQHRESATILLEKAVRFDPLNADTRINLSKCYASLYLDLIKQESPDAAAAYQNTLNELEKAEQLTPYDAEIINGALNSAVTIGNLEASLRLARQTVKIGPNNSRSYEIYGEVLFAAASYYLAIDDKTNARKMVMELRELPTAIAEQQKRANRERLDARMGRELNVTEKLAEIIEKSNGLLQSHNDLSNTDKEGN